jgi:hypothetical protein
MKLTKTVLCLVCLYASGSNAEYPYASKCPDGGQVFENKDYYSSGLKAWIGIYNFAQCNCTDYVAYWLNSLLEQHSAIKPMFTNHYYGYAWGDAYQWKDSVTFLVGILRNFFIFFVELYRENSKFFQTVRPPSLFFNTQGG